MKKKMLSMVMAMMLIFGMVVVSPMGEVKAVEEETIIDGSVLLDDETESIGEMVLETRGQYLQSGSSTIGKIGTGKIKVRAITVAHQTVSSLKVSVRVERLVNGSWQSYTSWSASKSNDFELTTAKEFYVPRGYYYRVISTHNANSDRGSSSTNAIYVD